jgi:hypothetical protein
LAYTPIHQLTKKKNPPPPELTLHCQYNLNPHIPYNIFKNAVTSKIRAILKPTLKYSHDDASSEEDVVPVEFFEVPKVFCTA